MPGSCGTNLAVIVAVVMIAAATVVSPHDGCLIEQGRIPFGNISAIEVDGSRLVYGSGTALVVEDVLNPRSPRRQGSVDLRATIGDLDVAGHLAFVVTDLGLHIINIENPSYPRQIGFETTPHAARAVQVNDRWAYVAGGEGLSLINIRSPTSPWRALSDLSPYCDYDDLALQYPLMYTIGCGFKVIDVSRPMFPTTLARLELGGKRIAVEGATAAVVGVDRLKLIDISDPANPVERGSGWTHGPARDVALTNETAVSSSVTGFTVFDIGSLEAPTEISHFALPGGVSTLATADGLAYAANLAYLRVVSLDDPASPSEITRIEHPSFGRVATTGRVAITTHSYDGPRRDMVTVLDVAHREMSEKSMWHAIRGPADVAIEASHAFVTADGGLYAIDLKDPASPVELSILDLIESEYVAVDSGRAYVATMGVAGFPSFEVVDISDPSDMVLRGRETGQPQWRWWAATQFSATRRP